MVELIAKADDDPHFIQAVQNIVRGTSNLYKPSGVYVTHISGWFDHKWLGFSGKVLGALGVWKKPLTLPPFHPHRVLSQDYYLWNPIEELYLKAKDGEGSLHSYQYSSDNLRRSIGKKSESAMYVWYSGETLRVDRSSLMVYVHTEQYETGWFVSFINKGSWKVHQTREISPEQISRLEESGRVTV